MKYSDARPLIRSGDPIGYTHKVPMWRSWHDFKVGFVRLWTRSRYSHVGVAWVVGERVFLLESVKSGVRNFPLSMTGAFDWVSRGIWDEAALTRGLAESGGEYSEVEGMKAPFGVLDMSNKKWQCAKYFCYVLGLVGVTMTPDAVMNYFFEVEERTIRYVTPD